jgi:hypothetical protein
MFCPACGQQQTSPEVRYCSRCGFSLRGVLSVRRKDIVQGGLLMFIGFLITFGFHSFVNGAVDAINDILTGGDGEFFTRSGPSQVWSTDFVLTFFSAVFFIWGLSRIALAFFVEWNSRWNFRLRQQQETLSPTLPAAQLSGSQAVVFPQAPDMSAVELNKRRLNTQELAKSSGDPEEPTRILEKR